MARVAFKVEQEGMIETIRAVRELDKDLRNTTNRELRRAAGRSCSGLVGELRTAAQSSGVPVARRVAESIRVKSDRLPVVTIGGTKRVGARGAIAAKLMWGSEHGPAADADRNRFGVPHGAGYWIAPTVARYGPAALELYKRAVYEILHKRGLV